MIATAPMRWTTESNAPVVSGGGYVVARFTRASDRITFDAIRMVNYGEDYGTDGGGYRVGAHTVVRGGWGFISEFKSNHPNTSWWLRKIHMGTILSLVNETNDGDPNGGQSHTERLMEGNNTGFVSIQLTHLGNEPNIAMYFDADATGNHVVCSVPRTFTYLPEMPQSYYFCMDGGDTTSMAIPTHGRVPPPTDVIHSMATMHGKVAIHEDASRVSSLRFSAKW